MQEVVSQNIAMKICTQCGQAFPATTEFFAPENRNKSGLHPWCRPCKRARNKIATQNYYKNNPDYKPNRSEAGKEVIKQVNKAYRDKHSEILKLKARIYKLEHYTQTLINTKAYDKRVRKATLKDTESRKEIRAIYAACPTGYHVDHIIPLNSELVCGLHVPQNLQYLPAKDNERKGNKFTPYAENTNERAN